MKRKREHETDPKRRALSIRSSLGPALDKLIVGDISAFRSLLKNHLETRASRSIHEMRERELQAIVEVFLDYPGHRIPELCLEMVDSIGNRYVDIYIAPINLGFKRSFGIVIELKYVNIKGIMEAEKVNITLDGFKKMLQADTEESLLSRNYKYWLAGIKQVGEQDSEHHSGQYETTTIGKIVANAHKQLLGYMDTIAGGSIADDRILSEPGSMN